MLIVFLPVQPLRGTDRERLVADDRRDLDHYGVPVSPGMDEASCLGLADLAARGRRTA
jgi:hypothetical protein